MIKSIKPIPSKVFQILFKIYIIGIRIKHYVVSSRKGGGLRLMGWIKILIGERSYQKRDGYHQINVNKVSCSQFLKVIELYSKFI
jgi:hypothetical protein